ncbi:MAG: hypothetical protein JWM41_4110 [Gemmatimonadetes bacterium]|nr:hypothetical protein [Gemmatimonadota bacterium]
MYSVAFVCESLTEATGIGTTVRTMLAFWSSLYALIVTEPGLRTLTCAPVPVGETMAMSVSDVVHETGMPVST